jgi:hypothetical protein
MRVARLDDLRRVAPTEDGDPVWIPVRDPLGIGAFGVNAWHAERAGDPVVEDHDEADPDDGGHEELYLVLRGRATFTVDGVTVDAPAGTFVVLDPPETRGAVAAEDATTVLAVGAPRGAAFTPSDWEQRGLSR